MRSMLLLLLLASGCSGLRLTAMTFNLFYGGTSLNLTDGGWCHPKPHGCPGNLAQVAAAIRLAGADVVGLEETEGNTEAIGRLLGWHWSARAHVVSRFPLAQVPGDRNALRAVLVEASPASWVLVGVAHAPSDPYGPYLLRDKGAAALDSVLKLERDFRAPPVVAFARRLRDKAAELRVQWLLAGDFNTPSQYDWTPAAVAARGLSVSVAWPVGVLIAEATGARDAYRVAHPDPVAKPGFTWTPWGPEDEPPALEVLDRVDWLLADPDVDVLEAAVVGEPGPFRLWPWPSDHYAVRAVLDFEPASTVVLAVAHSRVLPDEMLQVYCNSSALRLTLDGTVVPLAAGWNNVSVTLLAGGMHTLATEQVTVEFWVIRSLTSISLLDTTLFANDPVRVVINNAPGMMLDYLSIYPCGGNPGAPSVYAYTQALISGEVSIAPPFYNEGNHPVWPLPPGCYHVALLRDDDPTSITCTPATLTVAVAPLAWFIYVAPVIAGLLFVGAAVLMCCVYRRKRAQRFARV